MKRLLLFFVALFSLSVSAQLTFDPVLEAPHMNCGFRNGVAPNCLQGNFSVNASEMEGGDFTTSGSWCNSSNGYYFINGTDSISYDNVTAFQNITNFTIVVGFTPYNVSRFGGIVSLFNNDLTQTGWTLRTLNTSFLGFRFVNATNDTSYTFDENGHSGIQNFQNYTLVMTFDGIDFRVWLNNVQIERQAFSGVLTAPSAAKIRLGYYNSTSVNRFVGQIHFFQLYNYTLTPFQAANRTKVICGEALNPINSTRTGVFPTTNTTSPDWENASSLTRLSDPYNFRQFSSHANNLDFHRGVDFAEGNVGQPIYAIMNGTAVVVETDEQNNGTGRGRFGNWVLLEHSPDPDTGQPRHTAYLHMNQTPSVVENATVVQGQILGYVGQTGESIDTAHLHLELLRDLNEDAYANRSAVHSFRILSYTNSDNTNITSASNATHHIIALSQGYNDLDFVKIKIVGSLANRTVDYENKVGLNLSNADQSCVNDVCFIPDNWTSPYSVYRMNFSVPQSVLGSLVGVVIQDVSGAIETYTAPAAPNVTLSLSQEDSPDPVNVSTTLIYRVYLNVSNGTLYNVTVSANYSTNVSFQSATTSPASGNDTFLMGNLSTGIYSLNISLLVLNISNSTIFNMVNVSYANSSGVVFRVGSTINTTVVNVTQDAAPAPETPASTGGGSSRTIELPLANETCVPRWECVWWGPCQNGLQYRSCIALKRCADDLNIPPTVQSCAETSSAPVVEVPAPTVMCKNCEQGCGCYLQESRNVSKGLILMAMILAALSVFYVLMAHLRKQ